MTRICINYAHRVHNFIENSKWEFVGLKKRVPMNPKICLAKYKHLLVLKSGKEDFQTGCNKSLK